MLHSRAKSLAAFVPKLSPSTPSTNVVTPERAQSPTRSIGDLFSGESAPIKLGVPTSPTKEKDETDFVMQHRSTLTERPVSTQPRRSNAPTTSPPPQTTRSVSWFSRKPTQPSPPVKPQIQDEFTTLDISASLFPHGAPDPLDPSSFNALLLTATDLLHRLQTAYKEKVHLIQTTQPELDAQREEVEEAHTRADHLKRQLGDLSLKMQEQDITLQEMSAQLVEERMKAHEAREAAAKAVGQMQVQRLLQNEETPAAPPRSRTRKAGSVSSASDSGFESDRESVVLPSSAATPLSPPSPPGKTFDRCSPQRCGFDEGVVKALRAENALLKQEMRNMEGQLQGCIELVGALGSIP